MIIDFHTHMFPDKIAAKTIAHLADVCKTKPYTDGTASGLSETSKRDGVDLSVVLPVATKPSQFRSIHDFAMKFREGNLLSFGSIHPDSPDYKAELSEIKEMGFKGIKLHPDYQGADFNDIRYKRVIERASELDLIISVHAGVDPLCPDHVHCTPAMSAEVIRDVKPTKLVLAHLGGNLLWDDVERYLAGKDVYLDTAVIFQHLSQDNGLGKACADGGTGAGEGKSSFSMEQFIRIVNNHGKEKILFATDSPWASQREFIRIIRDCALDEDAKACIFEKNARKLLNI